MLPPMYFVTFRQMSKQLGQLDKWLETAIAFAESKKFDAQNFMGLRLAPDQFAFARQVQITTDTAKLAAARLSGKDAPTYADDEKTLEELRSRIAGVRAWLETLTEADLAEAATRVITQPRWEGKVMSGADYFIEHAVPNFFFHLSHAYAILRHAGVGLGKRDYLGTLTQRMP
jgi:hypothetical protein